MRQQLEPSSKKQFVLPDRVEMDCMDNRVVLVNGRSSLACTELMLAVNGVVLYREDYDDGV